MRAVILVSMLCLVWSCTQVNDKTVKWDPDSHRCRVFHDGKMWEFVDSQLCEEGR